MNCQNISCIILSLSVVFHSYIIFLYMYIHLRWGSHVLAQISSYWDGKICCVIMKRQDGYFLTISKHTIFRWVIYFNHSLIVCAHLCKSSCMRDTELTYTFLVNRLMKYPTFKDMKLCYILGKGWVDLCFLWEIRKRYSPIIRLAVYHIVCITHAKAFFPSRIFC